jgi:uncharacterized protein YodC (DUF2158 family)
MPNQIGLGDTVMLKSGGPIMTVSDVENDMARCEWFDSSTAFSKMFPLIALDHAE